MCGIAGALFWDAARDPDACANAVRSMTEAQRHRGPDGHGVTPCQPMTSERPAVTLGHTRLAVVDLSAEASQPMTGGGGDIWLTYNGETYNFPGLRAELEAAGHLFRSRSDTEVVLRAYEEWGERFVHRLRGMFALAVWDGRRQTLVLVRDRLGIKPLYYYQGAGYLLFASEVRALLSTNLVPRRIDLVGLDRYLTYQTVPAPRTLIEGVRTLSPGCVLTVDARGRTKCERYWDLLASASPEAGDATAEEATRRVRELLREAVSQHLVSDVPLGLFLSGGIDSSALVSLVREAGVVPRTYSVVSPDTAFDESLFARAVASAFETDHTEIPLLESDLLAQLPDALASVDHPSADGINTYIVSGAVRAAGITVALSGLGGDELFGGYPSFTRLHRLSAFGRVWRYSPAPMRHAAAAAVRMLGASSMTSVKTAEMLETNGSLQQTFPILRQLFTRQQRAELLGKAVVNESGRAPDEYQALLERAVSDHPETGVRSLVSYAEASTYMHDVLLRDTDQMSMRHGLEVRVPLLDHELVQYVMGLPDTLKFQTREPKCLLTRSLGLPLSSAVVHRQKQGFTLPFDPWMRRPLREFCEQHLIRGQGGPRALETRAVGALWQRFLAGDRRVTWSRPWALVALTAWMDRHRMSLS